MDAPFPRSIRPPPGLFFYDDVRREHKFSSLVADSSLQQPAPTEVRVKNTFLHVEDVSQPLQRSRSTSDLSTGSLQSSERLSQTVRLNHEGFDAASHGAAGSANDGPSGNNEREPVFVSRFRGTNKQPPVPNEVRVKNTFIHVDEDEPQTLQRSRSLSDLSSGSLPSDRPSPPVRLNYESFDPTPGAGSSRNRKTTIGARSPAVGLDLTSGAAKPPNKTVDRNSLSPDCLARPGGQAEADSSANDETQDEHWSAGAAKHAAGFCKPCAYYRTEAGCMNGRSCRWCHMPHESTKQRARPGKAQRARCKEIARVLASGHSGQTNQLADDLYRTGALSGANSSERQYLQEVFFARRAEMQEEGHGRPDVQATGVPPRSDMHFKMRL